MTDLAALAGLSADDLLVLDDRELAYLLWQAKWLGTARPKQIPPSGDWNQWGILAGRGFGKTLTGAQWIANAAYTDPEALPSAVIAPTFGDVKHTCFEGPAGLLSILPPELVANYNSSEMIITLANGAQIRGFSAEKPERLRGPQHARVWCFVAGTLVSTPQGDRPIETLRPGDEVLTRKGPRAVAFTAMRADRPVINVAFDTRAELVGTSDHLVFAGGRWRHLDRLREGDEVVTPDGGTARVSRAWLPAGRQDVYCLKVEGEPEYFANGILVHNCDELAAWQYADETWDMMMFGLRLGERPQVVWTTTPKPRPIVRRLVSPKPSTVLTTGSTYENKDHLPKVFFDELAQYEGTKLGRQELEGELIDPEESGIIKRSWLKLWPKDKPLPLFEFVLMSLDTAFTEATLDKKSYDPDYSAGTVWGIFRTPDKARNVILLDAWQEQLGLPDLIEKVRKELTCAYGEDDDRAVIKPKVGSRKPVTSGRKPDMLLIEDKGSGISLRQMLEREGIFAYPYNPGRADKLTRLHVVSPVFARRLVWVPESAKMPGQFTTWAEPVISQLCSFAGSGSIDHDDFVDSVSQAMRLMMDKRLLDATTRPKVDEPPQLPKQRTNPYAQ